MMAGAVGGYAQDEVADSAALAADRAARLAMKKDVKTRTVTGRVFGVSASNPLPGVLVSVSGYDGYSALTGEDGSYKIDVPEYATALTMTAPDFNTVRVGINKSGQLRDVILYSSSVQKNYGKDDNLLNVAEASDFGFSPALNVASEIEDQLGAYVRTVSRGGTPGIGSYMTMNGINSLYANQVPQQRPGLLLL